MTVVGAAIWAGTPATQADPSSLPDPYDEAAARMWPLLDHHLYQSLEEWHRGGDLATPRICLEGDTAQWRAYASWFVNLGRGRGQLEYDLAAYRRRPRWSPARYFGDEPRYERLVQTGKSGFVLGRDDRRSEVLITPDGEAIPVWCDEDDATARYWPSHGEEWLEPNADPRASPAPS